MASKTLIIGIGSTGAEIASRVIDRVSAQFGSFGDVPWIEAVCFDTAVVPKSLSVARTENVKVIGLPETDFRAFKNAPDSLSRMDFAKWSLPEPFQAVHASAEGAGNCRMVGRANLLYPKVFAVFHHEVLTRLERLKQVNLRQALQTAGVEANHPLENQYCVVVVGSLVGGTCSGTFIDVGYYLRHLGISFTPQGGDFVVTGIFSAPHGTYGAQQNAKRQMANVYAALTELNHFLTDGVTYSQRFPMDDRTVEFRGEAPFRATYVVLPNSSDKADVEKAHAGIGEFVAAMATSDMVEDVQRRLVDPVASLSGLRHRGRHLNFATFGVSVIEYPADRIRMACAERLVAGLLEGYVDATASPADAETFLNGLGLNLDGVHEALLSATDGGPTLSSEIDRRLEWAEGEVRHGNIGAMETARLQIEAAFGTASPPEGGLAANLVSSRILSNLPRARKHYIEAIQNRLDEALQNRKEGPKWCEQLLTALVTRVRHLEQERTGAAAHETSSEKQKSVSHQAGLVHEAANDVSIKIWRNLALRKTSAAWREASRYYWHQRLGEACGAVEKDLLLALSKLGETGLVRLCDPNNYRSMNRMLRNDLAAANRVADDLASVTPIVNGITLFEGAIESEYRTAMENLPLSHEVGLVGLHGEELARAWLVRTCTFLKGKLYEDSSPFSPGLVIEDGDQEALESAYHRNLRDLALERFFASISRQDILKLLYNQESNRNPKAKPTVRSLWDLSAPMADIDSNDSLLPPSGEGVDFFTPAFAFYYRADSSDYPYGAFAGDLPEIARDRRGKTSDPTRATILRARVGFSCEQIQAVREYRAGAEWWRSHSAMPLFSRRDVAWYPLDGSELKPGLGDAVDLVLLGHASSIIQATHLPKAPYVLSVTEADHTRNVMLGADVERAAYEMLGGETNDASAEVSLRRQLTRLGTAVNQPQFVQNVRSFIMQHATTHVDLLYRGKPLEAADVRSRVLRALDTHVPGALEAYYRTYPPRNIDTPETYHRDAIGIGTEQAKPAGYYCNGRLGNGEPCNRFFFAASSDPNADMMRLPERCPNCQRQLLIPGLKRFFRWLVPLVEGRETGEARAYAPPGAGRPPSSVPVPGSPATTPSTGSFDLNG